MTDLVLFPEKMIWVETLEQKEMCLMLLENRES